MQFCIQIFGSALNLFSVALPQRRVQSPYVRADRIISRRVENIALVTQIFLGVAQQQFAVFNVARREHLKSSSSSSVHWALSTSINASCGMLIFPMLFIRFFPSFCFSSSLRFRVISPP